MDVVSKITDTLSFCPGIPSYEIMKTISSVTGAASATLNVASAHLKGGWTYKLQVTKYTYQVGITKQTGSRYCQVGVDISLNVLGKSYSIYKAYAKTGAWWVSQKPF